VEYVASGCNLYFDGKTGDAGSNVDTVANLCCGALLFCGEFGSVANTV
jgi:hypothetical protein